MDLCRKGFAAQVFGGWVFACMIFEGLHSFKTYTYKEEYSHENKRQFVSLWKKMEDIL